ncbi:alpha-hydroxy-acid oxidizing protein [Thermosediminibacter oceani]|uniref:L-lactate oxidase n=1 Tax=Thermosediminibacter oceani (strain ATCC BAA-1034 / DSM 16646 / JW/IW-1228P) TaxID=555079 RepID=D9S1X8_THEOJ|nr:alpha-hydroxy-acid oxidizing protein [Thermosediminibacter oceani]ADL07405.1 FMN-dependent alpha-hydroxy acid dehydrogenase [Thermosediminibacter oceani DSM 16646]
MNINEIKKNAREKMKGYCRVCRFCDGVACAGEVPGMGGTGTGSSFRANVQALARVRLNMRTLHGAKDPDITVELFGRKLSMPILAAPITGSEYNMGGAVPEEEFIQMVISGSKAAGTIGMCGDGGNPLFYDSGLKAIEKEGGHGIAVMKPRENDVALRMAERAKIIGAVAVGMDVDGAGLITMALMGQPVGPKTREELEEIISKVGVPFILKGIMTVDEAQLAYEVGAKAIVVSNHGGRILDSTPGVAEVLPAIAEKLKGKITILADGGVRSGVDVLKYLALGADAVLVGRPVIIGAYGGGAEGVKVVLETMAKELKQAMILTGCNDIASIGDHVIYKPQ